VFVNGRFVPKLSNLAGLPAGVTLTNLAAAVRQHPAEVEAHLARHAPAEGHPFVALNTAYLHDGAFLSVGRGVALERPVHLIFVATTAGEPTVSYPRTLVVAQTSSQLTLVETYLGAAPEGAFTNAVTEV